MAKVDKYLIHAFEVVSEIRSAGDTVFLPMLLRVKRSSWIPEKGVPEYSELTRFDDIVVCLGTLRTLDFLKDDPNIISITSSRPTSGLDCSRSMPFVNANPVHSGTFSEKGNQALIAVIDAGIDVLHEAFLDSQGKGTRILAIWDQNDSLQQKSARVPFGREYTQDEINWYIQHVGNRFPTGFPGPAGAVTPYRTSQKGKFSQTVMNSLGNIVNDHGTHVTSIAAGQPMPGTPFPGGVAPEANILVVIPRLQFGPTDPYGMGYSASLIAALNYIKDFADRYDLPVVVNLSQGINAGGHDGTSIIEAAFDRFTNGGHAPGRIIVKSAGNEGNKSCHAKVKIVNNQPDILEWRVKRAHSDLDVIELWFKASDHLEFRLCHPDSEQSPWINSSIPTIKGYFQNGNGYKISYEPYHSDNGDSCLTVVISSGSAGTVKDGTWSLEIAGQLVKSSGEIHAWIERNNNYVTSFINHIDKDTTVNVPGTAHSVITVGSASIYKGPMISNISLATLPGILVIPTGKTVAPKAFYSSNFSSCGPTRDGRQKPEITAPGDSIEAAGGNSTVGLRVDSGTSMAAPHVTGAIALLLSYWKKQGLGKQDWEQLNAAQVRAALSQATQNYDGQWQPDTGFGILDVELLLKAFR